MRTIKIHTGPVAAKPYAKLLSSAYDDISVGTEHIYIATGHSVEHVANSMKASGITGFNPYTFQIINCGKWA